MSKSAVFVRDLGGISSFMTSGRVNECHAIPNVEIEGHAIRYKWASPHPAPKPGARQA